MSAWLDLLGCTHDVSINIEQIRGMYGETNPALYVPFNLTFSHRARDNRGKFVITGVEGDFKFEGQEIISRTFKFEDRTIEVPDKTTVSLEFPISPKTLSQFEFDEPVKKDIKCQFRLSLQVSELGTFTNRDKSESDFVTRYQIGSADVPVTIPHSLWNEKIQPGLGLTKFETLSIPSFNVLLEDTYPGILKELVNSQEYLKNGDYDKAVAHCRSALEPIKKEIGNWKELISSKTEYNWMSKSASMTFEWLDTIREETYRLTNKPHHYPSVGHFSKAKAEIVYLMTTAIVAYVGHLESKEKE